MLLALAIVPAACAAITVAVAIRLGTPTEWNVLVGFGAAAMCFLGCAFAWLIAVFASFYRDF